ncbi:MAG: hypothetical protein R2827_13815 [Bdellovibrionales bacterium]
MLTWLYFLKGNRNLSNPIITNQEPFDIAYDVGIPYTEREMDSLIVTAGALLVNGLTPAAKLEVEDALFQAAWNADRVSHFARILDLALDYGMIVLPSTLSAQEKFIAKSFLFDGLIHSSISDWAIELAATFNVDVYNANTVSLEDVD